MAPEHKLRVIAPDVGGGFGSKIFIYPEEVVCLWAAKKVGRPVKWTCGPLGSLPHRRAWPRPRHARRDWHSTPTARSSACGSRPSPISAPICRPSRRRCRPISTPRCCRASTTFRRSIARSMRFYTNTAPVDAYRGAGRPEATFVVERLVEVAARAAAASTRPTCARRNFIKAFPHQTPVIMAYDAGDYNASLKKAMEIADVKGCAKAQARSARHGKLRGIGYSTYIEACGIAPVAGGGLARRRRRLVGNRRGARQPDRLGGGADRLPRARPGPRDHLRPAGARSGSAFRSRTFASCMATPTRCSSAWAPTARAPARSACRPSSRRSTRSRPRPRRSPPIMLEAAEGDIDFKDGKFTVAGTDKSAAFGDVALNAYIAHKFTGAETRAGPEGRRVLRSDQLHLPGRLPHLRARGRYRDRQGRHRRLDRGGRLRHHRSIR